MTTTKPTTEVGTFTTRDVPWMAWNSAVINEAIPTGEAIKRAGLDWEVELRQVRFPATEAGGKTRNIDFKGRQVIVRKDTDEPFGIGSDDYEIVQNAEAFDFMDGVNPFIVAAGPLRKGRQIFVVCRSNEYEVLENDKHQLYVVLRTSHDLSRAVEVFLMPIRNMCMNQLPLRSFGRNVAKQRWSVRHVSTAKEKLAEAQQVITGVDRYIAEYADFAKRLVEIDLELDETRELLEHVLPDRPRRESVIEQITDLSRNGPNVGQHNTGWGLVNAVGEYFDHMREGRGTTPESRFTNALSGATNRHVNNTAQLLLRRVR